MRKRIISMFAFAISLSMVFSGTVFAQDVETTPSGITIEYGEEAEPVDVGDATIIELPSAELLSDGPEAEEIASDLNDLFPDRLDTPSDGEPINALARSNNQQYHFTGTIPTSGGNFTIYPIAIPNGQNIHVQLVGPSNKNLHYILGLYEINLSTGALTIVDSCTYSADTDLPQTVATVNKSGATKNYAIIVVAASGYSATDSFDINITTGLGGDPAESNDNAFTSVVIGTLTGTSDATLSGTTLDSPLDEDWFAFNAPNLADFKSIKIENTESSSVQYQLYYASGNTLIEQEPVDGIYPLLQGVNYIRVTDNGNNFSSGDIVYGTKIKPVYYASQAVSEITMGKYDHIPTQSYEVIVGETVIGEERFALELGELLTWKVTYLSSSGYLCEDADNYLSIDITDTAWADPKYHHVGETGERAKNGIATVTIECPPALGQIHQPVGQYLEIWYDYDCTLSMFSSGFGYALNQEPIFITSKII